MSTVKSPTLAKDIMVTKLVTLSPHMDVFEAIGLLLRHRISGAPVVDADGKLLGVFTEKSSLSVLVEAAYEQLPTTEVYAFMIPDPVTITEDTDLLSIAQLFLNCGARRLPVLRDEKLVGQVSRRDVLMAANRLIALPPGREKDILYLSSLIERNDAPIE
jgi:CBS domain-containing protein